MKYWLAFDIWEIPEIPMIGWFSKIRQLTVNAYYRVSGINISEYQFLTLIRVGGVILHPPPAPPVGFPLITQKR